MNNRRKFLAQTSMAVTAFLVAKPFNTLAGFSSPFSGISNSNNLLLLHTGNTGLERAAKQVTALKQRHSNVVLLHAGNKIPESQTKLKYDVIPATSSLDISHTILFRGNLKIGVISASNTLTGSVEEINTLSSWLKKEKRCNLVVCLSQLGYKNKNGLDDITLAAKSSHIDAILSGHKDNFTKHAMIALNKNNAEVIISHSANNTLEYGKIEIGFNRKGLKNKIAI